MKRIAGIATPISAAAFISALTVIVLLLLPSDTWQSWQPATCLGSGCFCEAINPQSPIRQTANTVSSLGFVFSGVFMLVLPFKASISTRFPTGYSILMGIACIIIGIGSAFYHASLTFIGQFFDVFGMFLLAAFVLVYAWERIYKLHTTTTLILYLTLNAGLTWLQIALPDTRRYVFAIVLIIALLFEYYFRVKEKPLNDVQLLRVGIGLLAGAYIIWILDNTRVVCFESSLLQGHAVWHLLSAVSVMFLHRYYMSEENLPQRR